MQAVPLLSPRLRLAVALQAPWCGLACVLGNNIFAISPTTYPARWYLVYITVVVNIMTI